MTIKRGNGSLSRDLYMAETLLCAARMITSIFANSLSSISNTRQAMTCVSKHTHHGT